MGFAGLAVPMRDWCHLLRAVAAAYQDLTLAQADDLIRFLLAPSTHRDCSRDTANTSARIRSRRPGNVSSLVAHAGPLRGGGSRRPGARDSGQGCRAVLVQPGGHER